VREALPVVLQVLPALDPVGSEIVRGRYELRTASRPDAETVIREGRDAVAILARSPAQVGGEIFDGLPDVRVVAALGSGADCIDVQAASARGIPVLHNPGEAPGPVAEYVIAAMLVLLKCLPQFDRRLRRGIWRSDSEFPAREAHGSVLGLVGFGSIGNAVASRAIALGMRVHAFDPQLSDRDFAECGVERCTSVAELLASSDVVSVHVPLTPETDKLIGAAEFDQMKPEAVLINTSRGPVVDTKSLVAALAGGRIAAAAIDVFDVEPTTPDHPLFGLENVLVTPHTAGVTAGAMHRLTVAALTNLMLALDGVRPAHLVEPSVWPPKPMASVDAASDEPESVKAR